MLVSSIFEQIKEVTGLCDQTLNFQAISRAVELLANEGLFDPLIGYINFSNNDTNLVTLPREVKTVLRLNVNSQPTFFRNRLFEFTLNTDGSSDTDEPGLAWSDRGYSPIQDERKLPGKLSYVVESAGDAGKTITVKGRNVIGDEITEVLTGDTVINEGELDFYEVDGIIRDPTSGICLLYCGGVIGSDHLVAQYYPDETDPMYRVIKLSKAVSNVRVMFRREVFEITSMNDLIPLHSKMSVIHATKAVRYFAVDEYDKGNAALAMAVTFIKKEQTSRDEQDAMAAALEVPTATDSGINVRDGIVVSDIYDAASEIYGLIGRKNLFDRITTAIEVLRNKAHWDSGLGVVDIWMTDRSNAVNVRYGKGSGYFVLPRFVESVVSLNLCNSPAIARNRWFEFHMNGTGETNRASAGAWDDAGETCIIQEPLIDPDTRRIIPFKLVASPDSSLDDNKLVRVFGTERMNDGTEREVFRKGIAGYTVPCVYGVLDPDGGRFEEGMSPPPNWVEVTRIARDQTLGYARLLTVESIASVWTAGRLMGYWYPDELEPKYRAIKVSTSKANRIRVLYRKRTPKITSMFQPIPLRSRLALETMIRALKLQSTDPAGSQAFEAMAVNYLSEERINSTPSDAGSLQFDDATMPGFTGNIQ